MNIFPKNTYFYYFFIGMLSIATPVFGAPATTATVSAYSFEVKVQKTTKLPVPNSKIWFDADLFLSDFAKTQSYVTVRRLENNELQNYLTHLQETARDLLKVKNNRKTIIDQTGIIFSGEESSAVIKTILRKSDSQLHVAITAYVHTATDAEIIKAICNLCNALFPQLTFMQKHGAVVGTCAVICLGVLGVSQRNVIRRKAAEIKQHMPLYRLLATKKLTIHKTPSNTFCTKCNTKISGSCSYKITGDFYPEDAYFHSSCALELIPLIKTLIKTLIKIKQDKSTRSECPICTESAPLYRLNNKNCEKHDGYQCFSCWLTLYLNSKKQTNYEIDSIDSKNGKKRGFLHTDENGLPVRDGDGQLIIDWIIPFACPICREEPSK
ncbi:hypothetical protein FJ366_00025 [Candidatus Dependentiae bacterium]|nr:hypothetical protein [Candidatus Dependentiae bacterium]